MKYDKTGKSNKNIEKEELYFDHYESRNSEDYPDFLQITICKDGEKETVINIDNVSLEEARELFSNISNKDSYRYLGFGEL